MQKAVERPVPAPKKSSQPAPPTQIKPPRMAVIAVPIRGMSGSPLVINAFSAKAREIMREKQTQGSVSV